MYLRHFGLTHAPLGKEIPELWEDGGGALLAERFAWLLDAPGLGLLTGEPGVGKTAALRKLTARLNPHRYQVIYLAETDFGRVDPDGHPNSPSCGHLKIPHLDSVTVTHR